MNGIKAGGGMFIGIAIVISLMLEHSDYQENDLMRVQLRKLPSNRAN